MMRPRVQMHMRWWQVTAILLVLHSMTLHTYYALADPMSASARAMSPLGEMGQWVLIVQLAATTAIGWQAVDAVWRRCPWAFAPWLILSVCVLMRALGTAMTSADATWQWLGYVMLAAICVVGAFASARTK